MPSDDYVFLRIEDSGTGAVLGGALETFGGDASGDVSVETRTLGASEAAEVGRAKGVVGARNMPITLVTPFDTKDAATADAAAAAVGSTWGLQAVGATGTHRTGKGVTVAVLDTGIHRQHVAFANIEVEEKDFTGEGDGDENGHGTHCAGTVCGGKVNGLKIGVAAGVEKLLVGKVLNKKGRGSTSQILDGLVWAAERGARVISVSIGLDFPGLVARLVNSGLRTDEATSLALEAYRQNVRLFDSVAALLRARSSMFDQCIVVAATGNESDRPNFEIAAAPPSAADGFLGVGALGQTGGAGSDLTVARFSNTGPDISAPGVAVQSAAHNSNDGLRTLDGTSMATPHVAGVAALWVEELTEDNPQFKVDLLEANITARAVKNVFASSVDAADRGAGLVQAPQP